MSVGSVQAKPRVFTVEQANKTLPYLRRIVGDITVVHAHVVELRRVMAPLLPGDPGLPGLEAQYERSMDRLGLLVHELDPVGVELREFQVGLIDFPSTRNGVPVLLCWKPGEQTVHHWHPEGMGCLARETIGRSSR